MAKKKDTAPVIDMVKYAESNPVLDQCEGCERIFDWIAPEGEIVIQKCLAYAHPEKKWPDENEAFATRMFTVREREGNKSKLVEKELPVVIKACPLATHYKAPEIVNTTTKVRAGQGRTKQGGNR